MTACYNNILLHTNCPSPVQIVNKNTTLAHNAIITKKQKEQPPPKQTTEVINDR